MWFKDVAHGRYCRGPQPTDVLCGLRRRAIEEFCLLEEADTSVDLEALKLIKRSVRWVQHLTVLLHEKG